MFVYIQNPDKNLRIAQVEKKQICHLFSMRSKSKRRARGEGSMSDDSTTLPLCAVRDILSRLPPKSITRFQSVSKPWSAVIRSPDFISSHLRRSSSANPSLLIRRFHNPSGSNFAVLLFNNKTNLLRDVKVPFFASLSRYPKIVGSCNGLLCLDVSLCYASGFFLWNVSTSQFKALPRPRITDAQRPFWMVGTGFGYNPQSNDYKLVRIVNFHRRPDELPVVRAEVYSWRTGCWRVLDRRVTDGIGCCVINEGQQGVIFNGGLHWLAIGTGKLADCKFVVSFDLAAEEFRLRKIPDFVMGICVKILGYEDSLALAVYPAAAVYPGYGRPFERMELWVLQDDAVAEKGTWNKVKFVSGLGCPEALLNDSELVMKRIEGRNMNLCLFNIYNEVVERLPSCESDISCDFYSYVDSVVPVDPRDVVEESEAP